MALLDRDERMHEAAVAAIEALSRPLVTCEPVIVEARYLLRQPPGATAAILDHVARGEFRLPLTPQPSFSLDVPACGALKA